MGWQLGATVFALLGFISGIGKRKGRPGASQLSRGPAIVQTTLIVALIGLILNARFASTPKPETDYLPLKHSTPQAPTKPSPKPKSTRESNIEVSKQVTSPHPMGGDFGRWKQAAKPIRTWDPFHRRS